MKLCLSQKQMQALEHDSIANMGIPSIVLMERAALAVVDCVTKHVDKSQAIFILCGKGNNGADGIAVGRLLTQLKYSVTFVTIGDPSKATPEYNIQESIAQKMGIPFLDWASWTPDSSHWIIDGLFGIGLTRAIGGDYQAVINKINDSLCENIIAIDIPSGISADSGRILGCALKCKYTVSFGYGKLGLYLNDGLLYSGEVSIPEIGFHKDSILKAPGSIAKILEDNDYNLIPSRNPLGNKGTYGHLLIIAGSAGMSGAAYLCAAAAYRTGAGLVKVLTVEENRAILQAQLPEAIIQTYSPDHMSEIISKECTWATHIIMGPGLGQEPYVRNLVTQVLQLVSTMADKCPMILDSDALNTISKYPELKAFLGDHVIITPHMKEMSRLTGLSISELKKSPIEQAIAYSHSTGVTCVLKDATSVIANGKGDTYLTTSGNSALAKAGTGDVLAGIIGGCTCLGLDMTDAAAIGSFLHGRAGSLASAQKGMHGVLATDLFSYITL